jgi:serine/threonine protein kinase
MREHAHIVALLATYSHQDRLHMIFPWADGNLYQFWNKSFPQDTDLGRGHDLARWMISQFIGLAEGLECIHTSVVPPAADDVQPESRDKTHGRHGDIKPENILWFRSATGNSPIQKLGNFKISDLGSTEFHGTHSQEVQANASGGFTETYKSPEFDMMKRVSPVSDIWSFGCVLLQFVVWYVRGWSGVEDFTKQRKVESNFTILGDQFFNFNERERTVEEKPCVPRVRCQRTGPLCRY